MITFPVSGVETHWWIPLLVAFLVSAFTSTGGLSGAFLLLPFQVSVLGFTGPAVSPTNLVFNIVAIPSGVYRYAREGRLVAPLVWATVLGTLPGVFIGAFVRIHLLVDPGAFKMFVGCVLLYIGGRLIVDVIRPRPSAKPPPGALFQVTNGKLTLRRVSYDFNGESYSASFPGIFLLSFVVGIIGGIYGIGGGAIIAPFLVSFFGLPIHTVAGASLLGTFVTSIAGVAYFTALAPFYASSGLAIAPDWMLGILFGIGGAAGMYAGARAQRFLPARVVKAILTAGLLFVSGSYVLPFLSSWVGR